MEPREVPAELKLKESLLKHHGVAAAATSGRSHGGSGSVAIGVSVAPTSPPSPFISNSNSNSRPMQYSTGTSAENDLKTWTGEEGIENEKENDGEEEDEKENGFASTSSPFDPSSDGARQPFPLLSNSEFLEIRANAFIHGIQVQRLLLTLMVCAVMSLMVVYISLRILAWVSTENDLFRGASTNIQARIRVFGLPAVGSMILSVLVYTGFRHVWEAERSKMKSQADALSTQTGMMGEICRAFGWRCGRSRSASSYSAHSAPVHPHLLAMDDASNGSSSFSSSSFNPRMPTPTMGVPMGQRSATDPFGASGFNHFISAANTPVSKPIHAMSPPNYDGYGRPLHMHVSGRGEPDDAYISMTPLRRSQFLDEHSTALPSAAGAANQSYPSSPSSPPPSSTQSSVASSSSPPGPPSFHSSSFDSLLGSAPSDRFYFLHPSNVLHPSDVLLLRQWPSWSHKLWAILFQYYIFLSLPLLMFFVAALILSSPTLSSWELTLYISISTHVSNFVLALLVRLPNTCFGTRAASTSGWGMGFRLSTIVSLLSTLQPLVLFVAHSFVLILRGLTETTSDEEQEDLQAQMDSVLQTYAVCCITDQVVLSTKAVMRYKYHRRKEDEEENEDAAESDASDAQTEKENPRPPSFLSKHLPAFFAYSLEAELQCVLYTILFPLILCIVNPDVLLIALPVIIVACIICGVRYLVATRVGLERNEEEEKAMVRERSKEAVKIERSSHGATSQPPHIARRSFRVGSELLPFASVMHVLYLATQWVCAGGFMLIILLNIDAVLRLIRPLPVHPSSSSSTGSNMPMQMDMEMDTISIANSSIWQAISSHSSSVDLRSSATGVSFNDLHTVSSFSFPLPSASAAEVEVDHLIRTTSRPTSGPWPVAHSILDGVDGHGRFQFDFSHTHFVGWQNAASNLAYRLAYMHASDDQHDGHTHSRPHTTGTLLNQNTGQMRSDHDPSRPPSAALHNDSTTSVFVLEDGGDGPSDPNQGNILTGSIIFSPFFLWTYLLFFLWVARSCFFLCTHEVKPITAGHFRHKHQYQHQYHHHYHQHHATLHEWEGGPAIHPYTQLHNAGSQPSRVPSSPSPSAPLVDDAVSEYIDSSLNPDQLSSIVRSLTRRRGCAWQTCCWLLVHACMFLAVVTLIFSCLVLLLGMVQLCVMPCHSFDDDDPAFELACQFECYKLEYLVAFLIMALILTPIPIGIILASVSFMVHCCGCGDKLNGRLLGLGPFGRLAYPGKFFLSPCFIYIRRAKMMQRRKKAEKERKRLQEIEQRQ